MTTEKETPQASFVGVAGRSRSLRVELDWPIEFDGKIYDHIIIKRATIGEWRRYFEAMAEGARLPMPCFSEPLEVIDSLDTDDDDKIQMVLDDFFPKRFLKKEAE